MCILSFTQGWFDSLMFFFKGTMSRMWLKFCLGSCNDNRRYRCEKTVLSLMRNFPNF